MKKPFFSVNVLCILILLLFSVNLLAGNIPVTSRVAMVVSGDHLASEAGVEVLKEGGNAVDAAVAVGYMLSVTYPWAGNIGGGGFMVIRLSNGKVTTIDFRERAPRAATRNMYLDSLNEVIPDASTTGYRAVGVPGTVAGFSYALKKYGTKPLSHLIAPAINTAKNGFNISWQFFWTLKAYENQLQKDEPTRQIFWKNDRLIDAGDLLVQNDLAETLQRIADYGTDGFYKGPIAQKITDAMSKNNGLITLEDLSLYQPVERPPVVGSYKGYTIYSMGPPSSGGILLIMMLQSLVHFPLCDYGFGSSQALHILIETEKRAFRDRAQLLGDADFVRVPVKTLISPEYAERLAESINIRSAVPGKNIPEFDPFSHESEQTTHFSVVDSMGNAVSCTYTLNDGFGAKIMVPGTGFFLNNEMDDFSSKPGSPNIYGLIGTEANAIAPEKRILSSMTPTIITKDDKLFMVIGSPGGPRIISTVLQVIMNVLEYGMNIQEAVSAPRIHHQWVPDRVDYEPFGIAPDVLERLKNMGHQFEQRNYFGDALVIVLSPVSGLLYAGVDPRQNGIAAGW